MTNLPESEVDAFFTVVVEAAGLAELGAVVSGYRCLLAGEERAKEKWKDGDPCGAELVVRYRLALDRYGAEWGVRVE